MDDIDRVPAGMPTAPWPDGLSPEEQAEARRIQLALEKAHYRRSAAEEKRRRS